MTKMEKAANAEGLRRQLMDDHKRLDKLFENLLAALRADARDDAGQLWAEFDAGLTRHMDLEEKHLFPAFSVHNPQEAAELEQEHDHIRAKLTELGVGVDLHMTRAETVSEFVELLRDHARREDSLAYRWAQRELSGPAREILSDRLE
jgi:hemerythrin-like domain-containing protein